jgi:hypothetical protein
MADDRAEQAKAAASLALAKSQRERTAVKIESAKEKATFSLILTKVMRERESSSKSTSKAPCECTLGDVCLCDGCACCLSYSQAKAKAEAEGKPLIVFAGQAPRPIPNCIVTRRDQLGEGYPSHGIVVSVRYPDGAMRWVANLNATATDAEIIAATTRKEVQAQTPTYFTSARRRQTVDVE